MFHTPNTCWGLSPRVRGNRSHSRPIPATPGSIPACAGEPVRHRFRLKQLPVYPRVCGGTSECIPGCVLDSGLSPRVRGNHVSPSLTFLSNRSIPACAGEPHPLKPSPSSSGVYPRVCGGTADREIHQWLQTGLSPRVRGNQHQPELHRRRNRSIPACAGEPHAGW